MRCYTAKPRWQWPVHLTSGYNRFARTLRNGTMVEERQGNRQDVEASSEGQDETLIGADGLVALGTGLLVALGPTLARLFGGASLVDAFWPAAVRTLRDEFALREHPSYVLGVLFIGLLVGMVLRRSTGRFRRCGAWGFTGVGGGMLLTHLLLDVAYFRGAFLLAPAAYVGWLMPALVHAGDGVAQRHKDAIAASLCVFAVCLLAVAPALPAMIGVAPSPPQAPAYGYGAAPGPFDTTEAVFDYPLPQQVLDAMTGDEETATVSTLTVRIPELPSNVTEAPLALLLHGFGYPLADEYRDWSQQLAAKGMVVIQIAYPSALDALGVPTDWEPTEGPGTSDHPQHGLRMLAMNSALEVVNTDVLPTLPLDVRRDVLWVGGHSLGAGIAMMLLPSLQAWNWGTTAVVVDLEQPYAHSIDPTVALPLQPFNGTTVAHVVVAEDDTSVGWCHGVGHAGRLVTEAQVDDVMLVKVRSDRHGFPPLVASHYLAASAVHDALADQAIYRRADMQADWLVAMMRNDTSTASFAHAHLVDVDLLSPMGTWSDGTPVNTLEVVPNALQPSPQWVTDCTAEAGE